MKDIYEYCDIKITKMKLVFVPEKLLVTKNAGTYSRHQSNEELLVQSWVIISVALMYEMDWPTQGFWQGRQAKKGQVSKIYETLTSYPSTSEWLGCSESVTWPKCAQTAEWRHHLLQCSKHDNSNIDHEGHFAMGAFLKRHLPWQEVLNKHLFTNERDKKSVTCDLPLQLTRTLLEPPLEGRTFFFLVEWHRTLLLMFS